MSLIAWFIEGKPVSDDEAREYRRKHPNLMMMKLEAPTAVQDRDAAIAQVHAEFAKAGLCIVPVEDIKQAVRAIEDLRDDIKHEFGVNSATRCDKTIQALCALLPKE